MKARRGDGWTEEDEKILRRMAAGQASAFLIGAKIKRSQLAIKKRASALGIKIMTAVEKRRSSAASLD